MSLHNELLKEEMKGIASQLLTTSLLKAVTDFQEQSLSSLTWEIYFMSKWEGGNAGKACVILQDS